jgi:hypothetical protein
MEEVTFGSSKNLEAMANGMVQAVNTGAFESYECERLRLDFGKFSILERAQGYKLDAVSDESGHADVGIALSILIPKAIELVGGLEEFLEEDEELYPEPDEDLDALAEETMPDEFLELRNFAQGN